MKKKYYSINFKINIIIISIFILIFIVMALINNFIIKEVILRIVSYEQSQIISFLTSEIESRISLLHSVLIKRSEVISKEIISDPEKAQKHLDSRVFLLEVFDNGIFLFSPDGKIIAESPFKGLERRGLDLSHREYIIKTLETKKPYISNPYITTQEHKSPVIMFTSPVFDENGNIIAILTGSLNLLGKNTLDIIKNKKIGKSGFMYLINSEGMFIVHPQREKIFTRVSKGEDKTIDKIFEISHKKDDKSFFIQSNFLIIVNRFNLKSDWMLVSNYPIEELLEPLNNIKFTLFGISLLFIWITAIIIPEITKSILSNLTNFTNHIKNIHDKRDNDRFYNIYKNDEIDILANAFNSMIKVLDNRFNEIKERKEQFELISTFASDMIYYLKPDNSFFYISPSCQTITGYTQSEFYRDPNLINKLVYNDDINIWESHCNSKEDSFELRILTKNGEIKWISHTCKKMYDENGNYLGIRGSTRDITQTKKLELSIKEQAHILKELIDLMPSIVILKDPDGKWLLANKYVIGLFNLINVNYIGKTDIELIENTLPMYKDLFISSEKTDKEAWEQDKLIRIHQIIPSTENNFQHFDIIKLPIYNEDGSKKALLVVGFDITEIITIQDQLNQAKKMEAIAQLATGIAHDFNNILMILYGYAELFEIRLKDDDPLKNHISNIKSTISRGSHTVKQLMVFSRQQSLKLENFDLCQFINDIKPNLMNIIRDDIKLEIKLSDVELYIIADKVQIQQVFTNIISNSVDALPSGGLIRILANKIKINKPFVKEFDEVLPGNYALISIADNGLGIDKQNLEHIFEPFFTTKEFGKGTGFGLSIVYGIILQHNGFIRVYSEKNKGTIFKIYIPLLEGLENNL